MKRLSKKVKKAYGIAVHLPRLVAPKTPLFLISHMRARTTLLSHILGSSPEICGHNETHFNYHGRSSYIGLKLELISEENFDHARYLHDKILHNHDVVKQRFIKKLRPKIIIVIRSPLPTINSIHIMNKKAHNEWPVDKTVSYYLNRLAYIRAFAKKNAKNYMFVNSDDFMREPDHYLNTITNYLGLKKPLTKNYKVFNDTGTAGKGDPSSNIQAGKIINTEEKKSQKIVLPEETTLKLDAEFNQTKELLILNSI